MNTAASQTTDSIFPKFDVNVPMPASTKPPRPDERGYVAAFYELAAMMDIPAMAISPEQAWREHMKPRLEALLRQEHGHD